METRNALYAAVGAPVAVAKTLNARLETLRSQLESRTEGLSETAQKRFEEWTEEGRQVVTKVSDGKMVDELASKVDFDQAREQVTKLRDQLEDMLATWRTSFRPDEAVAGGKAGEESTAPASGSGAKGGSRPATAAKPATKPSAKKPAAKKPAAQKSSSAPASPKKSSGQGSPKKGTTKSSSASSSKGTTKSAS